MDEIELNRRLSVLLATCQRANAASDPRPMLGLVTREVAALAALVEPPRIVGESPKLENVRRTIENIRSSSASVLITGERGTGKRLVGATIHHTSLRARGPLARLERTGTAAELAELFRRARGGSLYLSEIADLDAAAQSQVLRGLDDAETDVRFLAASARDLEAEVASGAFRRDLYYRLKVIHIALPPLREIAEDIPVLARHFLAHYAAEAGGRGREIELPRAAIEQMRRAPWPGNTGQLRAEVRRLVSGGTLRRAVARLEKEMVEEALAAAHENQRRAAKALGLSRQGLINKMKRYGMKRAAAPHSDFE